MFYYTNKKSKSSVIQIHYHDLFEGEGEDEHENESASVEDKSVSKTSSTLKTSDSRSTLILLDYKQFIAARCIQTAWRGHQVRQDLERRKNAAICIQRFWRGFSVRHNFRERIEARLQQLLIDHYNRAATKIQAAFRGWYTRQTVHDMHSLRRMQICAAEELLSCCAYKLHHLLRTYSIPGIYSMRNSHCLSKVEKLLSSITFRFHNMRVVYNYARKTATIKARREQFSSNKYQTEVPYPGPNFNSLCKPACEDAMFSHKEMDNRMFKIISEYEKTQVDPRLQKTHKSLASRKFRKHVESLLAHSHKMQRDFCGDVIDSMRKWKIWDDTKLTITREVLHDPDNLAHFLDNAAKILEEHDSRTCHCRISIFDTLQCV